MKKTLYIVPILSVVLFSFTISTYRGFFPVPGGLRSLGTVDFNLDGYPDIIVGHVHFSDTTPTVTILKNIQQGMFEWHDSCHNFTTAQPNIFAVPLNNDEYPDIVSYGTYDSLGVVQRVVCVHYNYNGDFSQYKYFHLNTDARISTLNHGDMNGDSFLDILIISNIDELWGILYNDGQGNLSQPEFYNITGYYAKGGACADLDGNGRDDVVITGVNTEIYYSFPEGFDTLRIETNSPKGDVYLVDFDHDGDIDIITFGCWGFTYSSFFNHTGFQTFEKSTDFYFDSNTDCNTLVDLNNDSLPDVLFYSTYYNQVILFYNKGDFNMSELEMIYPIPVFWTLHSLVCADFDGNGFQDIALTQSSSQSAIVVTLFNDGHGNFQENPIVGLCEKRLFDEQININPNPFHDKTTLSISLQTTNDADISIYDILGRLIKCISHQIMKGGIEYNFTWDATDNMHQRCRPGIYFVSLILNGKLHQTKKLIIQN